MTAPDPVARPEVWLGLREALGWSQVKLAKRMRATGFNWMQSTVAKTEAAARPVRVDEASALADLLSVGLEELVEPNSHPLNEDPVTEDLFALARDITRDLDEYAADMDGDGRRRFRSRTTAEIYDVDQDVTEGPVVLVRRSDGARFLVDVHVTVTPEPTR